MTTLPQTAPLRLPRTVPGGQMPGQLGPVQAHAHPVLNVPHGGGSQMGPADVWRVVRSNFWLILVTLVLFTVGGYLVNRFVLRPHFSRYESNALLRISSNAETVNNLTGIRVEDGWEMAIKTEAQSQATMLRHEGLLIEVLSDSNSKIRDTTWWREFGGNLEKAKEDLLENFVVAPILDSRLLSVSMEYRIPEDCKTIVNEIVTLHLRRERTKKNDDFIRKIGPTQSRVRDLEYNLDAVRRRIKEKAQALGQDAIAGTSTKQVELNQFVGERMRINRELTQARSDLANLHALNNTGNDPPGLDERLTNHATYNSLRQTVDRIDVEIATSDLAPGHRKYGKMQESRRTFAEKMDDVREEVKQAMFASLASEAQADIDSYSKELSEIEQRMERVSREVSASEAGRRELAALEVEEQGLSGQWEKSQEELSKLQAVAGTPEFANIDWARHPQTPDIPSFPKLEVTLTVAVLLGLALSLGIAFIRELTDNTVRTPQDLARVGNMNLLGMVPHEDDDPQAAGARLPLVIFDAPQSMLAESFRQVRSRLQHAASLETTRSMLVTSAGAGDGKTTVAVNLAAGLALNGRRILLVDANFRRPQMHNVFDTTNEYGFSDVLNSLEAFEQCVQATAVPNLSVLTSGAKPLNPTELLESQLLIDFIERALEEYDHVIFDTGPLPLVSETIALAPRVDGVITVVRARANSRGLLQRVRDTLRQVKAEHVGVVLNAVRAQAGGYYGRSIVDYYKYQNGGMNGHVHGSNGHSTGALVHSGMNGNGHGRN